MKRSRNGRRLFALVLVAAALACNAPFLDSTEGPASVTNTPQIILTAPSSPPAVETAPATAAASPQPPTPLPLEVPRIAIRTVGGAAEFYQTATGAAFVPRGVNYVDFYRSERGGYEDRVMNTAAYNPDRVREAFRRLAGLGYNTVRIFFDTCGSGPNCIGNSRAPGLNPEYLDNMVDLMHIAGQEGIYIIFTANSVPEEGQYWSYFDDQIYNQDPRFGFEDYRNSDWMHPAGIEIKRRFWRDLMGGLAGRGAPFSVVLGWQLTNELWLFQLAPPLSLEEGQVATANGQTYDMASPDQKRQMVVDGVLYYIDEMVAIIKEFDPEALTTVGFFAPQFPNPTGIGGDWYVDTAPLLAADPPVDFWDFHAYYDTDLSIEQQAENFGMLGYQEKPVIMGETGSGQAYFPSAYTGLTVGVNWIAESCAVGFDGWLNWGYYPWPDDLAGKPWALLDQEGLLLHAMAPINQPDACVVPELEAANVALGRPVRFSKQLGGEPAAAVVDAQSSNWSAGDYPPQWIEIELAGPTAVQRVGMTVSQWPPGSTRHQVWATTAGGAELLVADFVGFTTVDMALTYDLPVPLEDVTAVRVLTLESPSWVGWGEVEVISAPPAARSPCIGTAANGADLFRWPGQDQPKVAGLSVGQRAYLDGTLTDESGKQWLRLGAGLWSEAARLTLEGSCEPDALTAPPLPRTSPVTFRAEVPLHTQGEVFIAGEFPGTAIPAWIPYTILLQPEAGVQSVTVELPVGSVVQYLYTRGSWESIERPLSCGETEPRSFTVGDNPMVIEDQVEKWRDLDGCG